MAVTTSRDELQVDKRLSLPVQELREKFRKLRTLCGKIGYSDDRRCDDHQQRDNKTNFAR